MWDYGYEGKAIMVSGLSNISDDVTRENTPYKVKRRSNETAIESAASPGGTDSDCRHVTKESLSSPQKQTKSFPSLTSPGGSQDSDVHTGSTTSQTEKVNTKTVQASVDLQQIGNMAVDSEVQNMPPEIADTEMISKKDGKGNKPTKKGRNKVPRVEKGGDASDEVGVSVSESNNVDVRVADKMKNQKECLKTSVKNSAKTGHSSLFGTIAEAKTDSSKPDKPGDVESVAQTSDKMSIDTDCDERHSGSDIESDNEIVVLDNNMVTYSFAKLKKDESKEKSSSTVTVVREKSKKNAGVEQISESKDTSDSSAVGKSQSIGEMYGGEAEKREKLQKPKKASRKVQNNCLKKSADKPGEKVRSGAKKVTQRWNAAPFERFLLDDDELVITNQPSEGGSQENEVHTGITTAQTGRAKTKTVQASVDPQHNGHTTEDSEAENVTQEIAETKMTPKKGGKGKGNKLSRRGKNPVTRVKKKGGAIDEVQACVSDPKANNSWVKKKGGAVDEVQACTSDSEPEFVSFNVVDKLKNQKECLKTTSVKNSAKTDHSSVSGSIEGAKTKSTKPDKSGDVESAAHTSSKMSTDTDCDERFSGSDIESDNKTTKLKKDKRKRKSSSTSIVVKQKYKKKAAGERISASSGDEPKDSHDSSVVVGSQSDGETYGVEAEKRGKLQKPKKAPRKVQNHRLKKSADKPGGKVRSGAKKVTQRCTAAPFDRFLQDDDELVITNQPSEGGSPDNEMDTGSTTSQTGRAKPKTVQASVDPQQNGHTTEDSEAENVTPEAEVADTKMIPKKGGKGKGNKLSRRGKNPVTPVKKKGGAVDEVQACVSDPKANNSRVKKKGGAVDEVQACVSDPKANNSRVKKKGGAVDEVQACVSDPKANNSRVKKKGGAVAEGCTSDSDSEPEFVSFNVVDKLKNQKECLKTTRVKNSAKTDRSSLSGSIEGAKTKSSKPDKSGDVESAAHTSSKMSTDTDCDERFSGSDIESDNKTTKLKKDKRKRKSSSTSIVVKQKYKKNGAGERISASSGDEPKDSHDSSVVGGSQSDGETYGVEAEKRGKLQKLKKASRKVQNHCLKKSADKPGGKVRTGAEVTQQWTAEPSEGELALAAIENSAESSSPENHVLQVIEMVVNGHLNSTPAASSSLHPSMQAMLATGPSYRRRRSREVLTEEEGWSEDQHDEEDDKEDDEDGYDENDANKVHGGSGDGQGKAQEVKGSDSILLTPVRKRKKMKKRVTISSFVLPSPQGNREPSATPAAASTCRSILKTPGSGSAVHFFEMTTSQTPHLPSHRQKNKKIILPEPAPDGLRRSQRTRMLPLEWFRNERPIYRGLTVVDVDSPEIEWAYQKTKKLIQKRKRQENMDMKQKNLSVHVDLPKDCRTVENGEITVYDPSCPEKETRMECYVAHSSAEYFGPDGNRAKATDPFVMCKLFDREDFATGELLLRSREETPTQTVGGNRVLFHVVEGKVAVTVHRTTSVVQSRDVFVVPPGNTYSIRNLRNKTAKLYFFLQKNNLVLD